MNRLEVIFTRHFEQCSTSKRGFIIEKNLSVPFKMFDQFSSFDARVVTDRQFRLDFVSLNKFLIKMQLSGTLFYCYHFQRQFR